MVPVSAVALWRVLAHQRRVSARFGVVKIFSQAVSVAGLSADDCTIDRIQPAVRLDSPVVMPVGQPMLFGRE